MLFSIILLCLAALAQAQSPCDSTSTGTFNQVVLEYTPYVTPQIAPVSTIYRQIETTWYNAVDCRYVTPVRVDKNVAADGPFTTYVYSPTLTLTRVGCMPETTAMTRRDVRGGAELQTNSIAVHDHKMNKRSVGEQTINDAIDKMNAALPPDAGSLTVEAYNYLVSVNTAIFAVNLVTAGFSLNQTCEQLQSPASQVKLLGSAIDPVQAANIVCFAATNGLFLQAPVSQVINDLQALAYAVELQSKLPAGSDDLCTSVNISEISSLGIDATGLQSYLCPDQPITSSIAETTTATNPLVSAGTTLPGSVTISTGGPYANSTTFSATASPAPFLNSSTTALNSNTAPYANSTTEGTTDSHTLGSGATGATRTTYSTGGIFPNVTSFGPDSVSPLSTFSPPISSATMEASDSVTTATASPRYRRY